MSDPIDAAIKVSETPAPEQHAQLTVTIATTGRHVMISFPQDMTDSELLEFIGWEATNLRQALAQERLKRGSGRIIVPAGVMPS